MWHQLLIYKSFSAVYHDTMHDDYANLRESRGPKMDRTRVQLFAEERFGRK